MHNTQLAYVSVSPAAVTSSLTRKALTTGEPKEAVCDAFPLVSVKYTSPSGVDKTRRVC